MTNLIKRLNPLALAIAILSTSATSLAAADALESTTKLLSVQFEPREVVKVEAGDFHFLPGQIAPIHSHAAPAIGYVSKGAILYQVEGEKPQLLREGDAFYEPAGPRILRFDNASATEEAIFIDFNLQQKNEPFIVFEKKLTEAIDRRELPTLHIKNGEIDRADIFVSEIEAKGKKTLNPNGPLLGYVAQGVVNVSINGLAAKEIIAGGSFSLASANSSVTLVNGSSVVPAKVIAFHLQ